MKACIIAWHAVKIQDAAVSVASAGKASLLSPAAANPSSMRLTGTVAADACRAEGAGISDAAAAAGLHKVHGRFGCPAGGLTGTAG